jgi:hypothetical protein
VVNDGDGLVAVKYRVEAGTFIRLGAEKAYGASRVGVSKEFAAADQFVAVTTEDDPEIGPAGTNLHCVVPSAFAGRSITGRRVVCGSTTDGDLMEVTVGAIEREVMGEPVVTTREHWTSPRILGVIIGVYRRE